MTEVVSKDQPIAAYDEFRAQLAELGEHNATVVFNYASASGNREARSHVYKLRQTKSAVEKVRKAVKSDALEYGRRVDSEAKDITASLEEMIAVHETPIKEIEDREKARVAALEERVIDLARIPMDATIDELAERIAFLEEVAIDESFEEYVVAAAKAKDAALIEIRSIHNQFVKSEADKAELLELRRLQAEKEQKERDELIAAQARENARLEAEANAERERVKAETAAKKARDEAAAKAQEELNEAQRQRDEVEAKANAERREAVENAQRERDAAAKREAELVAEAEIAKREKAEAELRAAAEKKREADELAAREADKSHRRKINGAAADALVGAGFSLKDATKIVVLIVKGAIPGVTVNY